MKVAPSVLQVARGKLSERKEVAAAHSRWTDCIIPPMRSVLRNLGGALRRVFPDATGQAQAVTFNLFLSFFPLLFLALGIVTGSRMLSGAVGEMNQRILALLPPGSRRLVTDYLVHQGASPLKWSLFGFFGTLLVGTQVMAGMLQGVQLVHNLQTLGGWWKQQVRGLFLLLVCTGPWVITVAFTVFGQQVRGWMIRHFGLPALFQGVWLVVYVGLVLVLAILQLALIYRAGRPGCRGWNEVLPGAVVATLLWWVVNSAFGFYVRHVPYGPVYGGLAAVIGLLVWMNLTVLVVFIGAAFNAEAVSRRAHAQPSPHKAPPATRGGY